MSNLQGDIRLHDGERVSEPGAPRETSSQRAIPVYFGPTDRSLFGFYHPPSGATVRDLAVVLCNPLGFEAMSAHRTYRHLAERLAANGFPSLRFDYDGTGNSAGGGDDPVRVAAWTASVRAAIAWVRATSRARNVGLFGVRFGATLASLAAAQGGDVEALVAWAPIVSGAAHVRELRAFRLLKTPKEPAPADGSEEVGGHVFAGETLTDMAAVDLRAYKHPLAKRALVISRTEQSREEPRYADHLSAHGTPAEARMLAGYAGMMRDDPYETAVPFATLDAIVDWLSREHASEAPSRPSPASVSTMAQSSRVARATAVRETALRFGEGSRLFGVLAEGEGSLVDPRLPAVFFLNVGANHLVGPHRMNVTLCRELASRGYLTFRLDAAGLGDSVAAPGTRENRIYTKDSISDVTSAMDLLGGLRGVRRFVLVGLCSGAYLAHHTAIADARVVGQVQLSPYAFEWKEGDAVAPTMRKPFRSTRFYVQALLDADVWLRALRGDVEVRAIAGALAERLVTQLDDTLPALENMVKKRSRPRNEVERAFLELCDRGVETLMVLSFDDGGVDMVAGYLGTDARRLRTRTNFSFKIVEGADHTFSSVKSQRILHDLLTTYLETRFSPG